MSLKYSSRRPGKSGPAQLQRISIILRNNAAGNAIDAIDLARFPPLAQYTLF